MNAMYSRDMPDDSSAAQLGGDWASSASWVWYGYIPLALKKERVKDTLLVMAFGEKSLTQ